MTSFRVPIGSACVSILLVSSGIWTVTVTSSPILMPSDYLDTPAVSEDTGPLLDLFGNEIETAVGDYRVDVLGELYERHAPDTAIAKLGVPET